MKKGWLVVNNFIQSEKFAQIYSLLQNAADYCGLGLELKRSGEITCEVGGLNKFGLPDFALFWDKDVCLAECLENSGVRTFNSSSAIAACDDKRRTAIALAKRGLPIPKTIIAPKTFDGVGYNDAKFLKAAIERAGLPAVVKEAFGSFGQQVYLARDFLKAQEIVKGLGSREFLVQEFICESAGRDARVNVVGGKTVCAILRVNEKDFRSNVTGGGKPEKFVPSPEVKRLAEAASAALGLDFAGVDVLFGKDGPLVCEVNSNPHFKSTLDCTGIDLSVEILAHIKESLC